MSTNGDGIYVGTTKEFDDTLVGGAGDDFLNSSSGDDILDGGSGIDDVLAGSDSDPLIFRSCENE